MEPLKSWLVRCLRIRMLRTSQCALKNAVRPARRGRQRRARRSAAAAACAPSSVESIGNGDAYRLRASTALMMSSSAPGASACARRTRLPSALTAHAGVSDAWRGAARRGAHLAATARARAALRRWRPTWRAQCAARASAAGSKAAAFGVRVALLRSLRRALGRCATRRRGASTRQRLRVRRRSCSVAGRPHLEDVTHARKRRNQADVHVPLRVLVHALQHEAVARQVGVREVKLNLAHNLVGSRRRHPPCRSSNRLRRRRGRRRRGSRRSSSGSLCGRGRLHAARNAAGGRAREARAGGGHHPGRARAAPGRDAAFAMVLAHQLALLNSKRVVRGRACASRSSREPPRAAASRRVARAAEPRLRRRCWRPARHAGRSCCRCWCARRARRHSCCAPPLTARGSQGLRFEVHVSTFDETLDKSSFASAAGARRACAAGAPP